MNVPHGPMSIRVSNTGIPTDGPALVRRYRNALADAMECLAGFGHLGDVNEIMTRHGFVYVEPKPEVRLSVNTPPAERLYDEHTR